MALTALVPLTEVGEGAVEALLDRAFGTDRRARTAYRIRVGTVPIPELSFAALDDDGGLAGTIQCWPIAFAADDGRHVAMVMVGPVAVEPDLQRTGIGRLLMERMLEAASISRIAGAEALMLIGDPEYYGRFFGFTADRTGAWRLPGPFAQRRLLARGPAVPDVAGSLGPRVLTSA
jgi:predicted N-acetyltransferase YhbS